MQEHAISFLHDLVAIESLSGQETAVAQYLVTQMNQLGFINTQVDVAGNAIGTRENPAAEGHITREIVLLGHMDTVPGDIPVHIADGLLHGRGAVDAKGPLAAFVIATAQANLSPGTRVIVIGATEEEAATSKGARHAMTHYHPDFCIIGEPSGWDGVTLGYKGRILIDYTYTQPMSHTAGKVAGAAETGIAWLNALTDYIEVFNFDETRLFNKLLPSIRDIHTDSDGITNSINIKVGIRLPPNFDIEAFEADVVAWKDAANIRFYGYEAAFQSKRSSPLAQKFNQVMLATGIKPRFKLKTGTSDMNVVGPIWDCPIVAYGPGDSQLDHTPEEHIDLQEYQQAIDILRTVLEEL